MVSATLPNPLHPKQFVLERWGLRDCVWLGAERQGGGEEGITIRYTQNQSVASSIGSVCWSAMCRAAIQAGTSRRVERQGGRYGSKRWDRRMGPFSLCSCVFPLKKTNALPQLMEDSRGGGPVVCRDGQMVKRTTTGGLQSQSFLDDCIISIYCKDFEWQLIFGEL